MTAYDLGIAIIFASSILAYLYVLATGKFKLDGHNYDITNLKPDDMVILFVLIPGLIFLISVLWPIVLAGLGFYMIARMMNFLVGKMEHPAE